MSERHPIHRLLIANRGEIAVRIARGAREAGIAPLGIYSEADAHALHVDAMDDAVCIGPGPATESYLNVPRVIAALHELKADAVHPGYGFLSEQAHFARAVRDAGAIFVGPPPEAIETMGDKSAAKRLVELHGVPVLPGYDGADQSGDHLRAEAERIGVPLVIKATAGGGGRGLRVVTDLATFDEALGSARREAAGAFGDERMLLERYVVRPRHIEFQILADAHGTTIHLGERECSIQRRHQKIVEEAPSVALTPALRDEMGAAAVRAARAAGYVNAGTVEFLLDEKGKFYFLEMNARLQVEHPVTEAVHGVDLVRLQLAIASGAALQLPQAQVSARGWAIEARINAEDPASGYLPATGSISHWEAPSGPGIRVDSGVRDGSEVSIYYDSLLAKLIAWGPDRPSAIARLTEALEEFRVEGVPTNIPLHLRIARDVTFRAGHTTTAYLSEHENFMHPDIAGEPDGAFLLAIGAVLDDPHSWRIGSVGIPVSLRARQRHVSVVASRNGQAGRWRLNGDLEGDVDIAKVDERITVRGADARWSGRAEPSTAGVAVTYEGERFDFHFEQPPALGRRGASTASHGSVTAPMPGKIVSVAVAPGDSVAERDLLIVLEAMKMEHRIEASGSGVIKNVTVAPGQLVTGGATLVEFE